MKVWCEECKGMQWIENNRCPFCKGEGYTENNDIDYQARVGRATIKLLKNDGCMEVEDMLDESDSESVYKCEITNVKSLLEWAESEGE